MQPRTAYTLTATDADGDTDTYIFHIAVEDDTAPDFDSTSAVDVKFTVGEEISPTQLPAANNGNGTLEYVTTALPGGLRFNTRSRRISGTPVTVQPRTQYSLTVEDYDGDTATFNYHITVEGLAFANPPVIDRTFIAGSEITAIQLPSAVSDSQTLTYTTTALPAGLTFDPGARTVSGTPSVAQARTKYTLTAVDGDGNIGTYDFYITVEGIIFNSPPEIDVSYIVGSEITPLRLPSASISAGALTYSTTALPAGLTFDPDTRRISGTPDTRQGRTRYTLTATDGVNSATFDFHITVDGIVFARPPVIDRTFIVGAEIAALQLPEATGDGTLTYTTTNLPAGLVFDSGTRTVSGTPATEQARTAYTLTVADGVNLATFDFYITVENITFASPVIDKLFVVGTEITAFWLPGAVGGSQTLTYSMTTLPTGLVFDSATRRISGTPSVTQARTGYTLTAVDKDGNRATYDFYITVVNQSTLPTFGSAQPVDWTFTPENIGGGLPLPRAVGGTGRLTYAVNPALPSGLSLNAGILSLGLSQYSPHDRLIVNFPAVLPRTQYTLTATDENGNQATWTFHIAVADTEPDFGSPPPIDLVVIGGVDPRQYGEHDILVLPPVTLGNGAITYRVSGPSSSNSGTGPHLPLPLPFSLGSCGGLVFDGFHFDVHPIAFLSSPAVQPRTRCTLTATDADGDTATWTFHFTAEENTTPDFSAAGEIDMTFASGAEITPLQLPEAVGGNKPFTGYAITSGALPQGLVFNIQTRTISGTPVGGRRGRTQLVMTATDRNGDTADFAFHITVEGIAFAHSPAIDKTFIVGTEITAFTLPEAVGDSGALTYSTTALPDGLSFDPDTRTVSGTPSAGRGRTVYTLTATDSVKTATLDFHITVEVVSFAGSPVIDRTFTSGEEITAFNLPEAVSAGSLTYSTTALPDGLSFDPDTRTVSGTPSAGQGRTAYTLTAVDGDGNRATYGFHITVVEQSDMPTVTISGGNAVTEGENAAFTLNVTPVSAGNIAVNITVAGVGNFIAGSVSTTVTVPANTTVSEFIVATYDDDADEPNGSVSVTVDMGAGYVVGSPSTATVNVNDNDDGAKPVVKPPPQVSDNQPHFGSPVPVDKTFVVGAEITAFILPSATGGDGTLTYTATLPEGLVFDPGTRTVSGTPATVQGKTGYTLTAEDEDGDTAEFSFYITVETDTQPAFDAPSAISLEFTVGEYNFVILPPATGGNGEITYEVSPALPEGLRYYAPDRILGAPSAAHAAAQYTVTATDANGDTATMTFTLAVLGAATVAESVNEANAETLPRVARAIASDVTGALQDSIRGAFSGGAEDAFTVKGGDWRQFLAAEANRENERGELPEINLEDFAFSIASSALASSDWDDPYYETGGLSVGFRTWGRGYRRNIDTGGNAEISGGVTGGIVGVDTLITPNLLFGVSANLFNSEIDFRKSGEPALPHRTEAWSFHPYLGWQPSPRVVLWITAGYGLGDVEVAGEGGGCGPLGNECLKSGINLITGGGGGSVLLGGIKVGKGRISVDMAGDAALVRVIEDGSGGFETDGGTARLGLDFSYGRQVGLSGSFSGDISLAYRYDFGDSGGGSGLESGAGIHFNIPGSGLRVNADGRALLSGTDGVDEYGFSGDIAWSYDSGGTGPYVSFSPQWGATNDKRDELWERGIAEARSTGSDRRHYDIEAGYGVGLPEEKGVMKLFARSEIEDGAAVSRSGGVDFEMPGGLTAGYETVDRQGAAAPEHRGYLRFSREF